MVVSKSEMHFRIVRPEKISITDIQRTVREAWSLMRQPGANERVSFVNQGLDRVALPARLSSAVEIRPDGAGVGALDLTVVLYGKIAWDICKHVLLPHVREIWGTKPAHLHGIAVLSRGWFYYQLPYQEGDVRVEQFSGNALARFTDKLLDDASGMQMGPASMYRYLNLQDTSNSIRKVARRN